MSLPMTSPGRPLRLPDPAATASMMIVIYVAFLVGAAIARQWLVDPNGHPILIDYLSMSAAGRLAVLGHAAAAYDWVALGGMMRDAGCGAGLQQVGVPQRAWPIFSFSVS